MTETIHAWQCVGCGRIDGPAPCVGICRDEPVELVGLPDFEAMRLRARAAEERSERLAAALRRIVATHPKGGAWEASYAAMVEQAAKALAHEGAIPVNLGEGDALPVSPDIPHPARRQVP